MTDKDIEIQNLKRLIKVANDGITEALQEMQESRELVHYANQKLQEVQEENRRIKQMLLCYTEYPDPEEAADLLTSLDRPCGFVNCTRSERAARCIRDYARANAILKAEIERLKNGTDKG